MFRGQIFLEIQNAALRFQNTKNSLAGASCLTQSLFPGWTPISYCFHLAPITRQILRQISSTLSHKAPILWLSGELGEHNTSLGLEIMGRPFSKWIHINFCCEYVKRGSCCWLAGRPGLPASLSLSHPSNFHTPSHPLWLFYSSLPGSTMLHWGLASSKAVDSGDRKEGECLLDSKG